MPANLQFPNFLSHGSLTLSHLGVIQAEGADAASFLQGQLTHDVLLLPVGQARFAGYCSAKGRLMASFWVLKISPEKFLLVCHADLIASMVKRLSMFVMRAKVKLTDASHAYALTGFIGQTASIFSQSNEGEAAWHVLALNNGHAHLLNLYPARTEGGNVTRALLVSEISQGLPQELVSPNLENLSESDWQLGEVLSGISMVQAATTEAFVPQMLNYESVDGVSFKKGCYPGQEVVARSQFRGTLKRRAYVVSADAPMTVGQEIFASEDETQSCGMVSSAAVYVPVGASEPQSFWGIVSMQTTAADQSLHLGSSHGHKLNVHALPYALLEDI